MYRFMIALCAASLISATTLSAQEFSFGLGAGSGPQYSGSDDYDTDVIPFLSYSNERLGIDVSFSGIEWDLINNSGPFSAGPILRYNGGRDPDDIDNAAVAALPEIDGTFEVGGFLAAAMPIARRGDAMTIATGRLTLVKGVDGGHDGTATEISGGLTRVAGRWRLGADLFANFGDESYNDTFYGVDATTGSLAAYSADGGLNEVGLGLSAGYQISDNLSAMGVASYSVLQGDAADSPIVTNGGDDKQLGIALGLVYTFN